MRFPIASLIMLAIAGILLFLFVIFNYAFMGEDGLREQLRDSANRTMTGERLNLFNQQQSELSAMFGMGCVLCILLAIVFFVIEVLGDGRNQI